MVVVVVVVVVVSSNGGGDFGASGKGGQNIFLTESLQQLHVSTFKSSSHRTGFYKKVSCETVYVLALLT